MGQKFKQLFDHESYGFTSSKSFYAYIIFTGILYPVIIFSLPEFKDYQNYLAHVNRSVIILANYGLLILNGSLSILMAEPLWFVLLALLNVFLNPALVLGLVVGLSFSLIALGLAKINKMPWISLLLILIFYPIATKYFMQIRQGFAIALYIWAYTLEGKKAIVLRLLTPFIHTSLFLLLAVEAVYEIFKSIYFSKRLTILFSSFAAVSIVIIIPIIINLVGAEAFVSEDFKLAAPEISGIGVIIWSIYGVTYFLFSRPSKEAALGLTGILVFLFSQFYIDIGSRLIPLFLPFLIASYSYESLKKQFLVAVTLLFGLVLWLPTIVDPSRVFTN